MDGYVLAAEIGGTKLQAALGTANGEIIERWRGTTPADADAEAILARIEQPIRELADAAAKRGAAPRAIGVGFGGPIDTATGRALVSHQVEGWRDFPLREWFEEKFDLPARIANDANAAGWGEYVCGSGRGTRTFCYMNIGSGIGGALIVDGALYDGQGLGAFEIGHTAIPDPGAATPGASLKLEDRCSGWAIERRVRTGPPLDKAAPLHALCKGDRSSIACETIAEAARRGDAFAANIIREVAAEVGLAIANCITLVHPERFALGGGVSLMGDILLEPLRKFVDQHVFAPYRGGYAIVEAELREDAVLAGALLLAAPA